MFKSYPTFQILSAINPSCGQKFYYTDRRLDLGSPSRFDNPLQIADSRNGRFVDNYTNQPRREAITRHLIFIIVQATSLECYRCSGAVGSVTATDGPTITKLIFAIHKILPPKTQPAFELRNKSHGRNSPLHPSIYGKQLFSAIYILRHFLGLANVPHFSRPDQQFFRSVSHSTVFLSYAINIFILPFYVICQPFPLIPEKNPPMAVIPSQINRLKNANSFDRVKSLEVSGRMGVGDGEAAKGTRGVIDKNQNKFCDLTHCLPGKTDGRRISECLHQSYIGSCCRLCRFDRHPISAVASAGIIDPSPTIATILPCFFQFFYFLRLVFRGTSPALMINLFGNGVQFSGCPQ